MISPVSLILFLCIASEYSTLDSYLFMWFNILCGSRHSLPVRRQLCILGKVCLNTTSPELLHVVAIIWHSSLPYKIGTNVKESLR